VGREWTRLRLVYSFFGAITSSRGSRSASPPPDARRIRCARPGIPRWIDGVRDGDAQRQARTPQQPSFRAAGAVLTLRSVSRRRATSRRGCATGRGGVYVSVSGLSAGSTTTPTSTGAKSDRRSEGSRCASAADAGAVPSIVRRNPSTNHGGRPPSVHGSRGVEGKCAGISPPRRSRRARCACPGCR